MPHSPSPSTPHLPQTAHRYCAALPHCPSDIRRPVRFHNGPKSHRPHLLVSHETGLVRQGPTRGKPQHDAGLVPVRLGLQRGGGQHGARSSPKARSEVGIKPEDECVAAARGLRCTDSKVDAGAEATGMLPRCDRGHSSSNAVMLSSSPVIRGTGMTGV